MDALLAWSVSSAILSSMLICWLLLKPFVLLVDGAGAPNANPGVELPNRDCDGVTEGAELPNTGC